MSSKRGEILGKKTPNGSSSLNLLNPEHMKSESRNGETPKREGKDCSVVSKGRTAKPSDPQGNLMIERDEGER